MSPEAAKMFVEALLWVCGAIVGVGSAVTMVVKLFGPYKQLKKEVAELRLMCKDNTEKLQKDYLRFNANDKRDNLMMEALFTLIEHERTSNSTGLMEATSKKLQTYLIHREVPEG